MPSKLRSHSPAPRTSLPMKSSSNPPSPSYRRAASPASNSRNLDPESSSLLTPSSLPAPAKDISPAPSISRSFAYCALYGTTSVTITFFNKAVFSIYRFNFPCFMTLVQISLCISLLTIFNKLAFIRLPTITREMSRSVFPLTFCWWLYVVSGISALRYLNIPMFSTLRKSTALIVLILESVVLKKQAKPSIWACIFVMVLGGFIAGVNDLSFSLIGYLLVSVCCVSTALYLILIVKIGKRTKLDTFGLLYYNNILSFPLMLAYLLIFTNEPRAVPLYPQIRDPSFWAFLLFSAAQATVLNIAIFLCTKLNSPLATTVTGQMKDFVTISMGLFIFGDVKLNAPNLMGLCISMIGSLLYSVIKLFHARSSREKQLQSPKQDSN